MAKTIIPNPNQRPPLTESEREILNSSSVETFNKATGTLLSQEQKVNIRRKTSGHMITVPDDIWEELENYMANHPEEGSKSGLITRLISAYIKTRKNE